MARLLLLTQLVFNLGFYLVVPYIAVYMAEDLLMAAAAIGIVLGVRTFSQQGLFFVGGALADRFGTKPVVLTGCLIRVAGFCALGFAETFTTLLLGAVLTGFAAALFSPAVESALARQGGELERRGTISRTELFGLFAICGEVGMVTGPLLGALLLSVDFTATCLAAAGVFVLILLAHARWLPASAGSGGAAGPAGGIVAGWGEVLGNRTFLLFALAYSGYLLSFNQLYLALPLLLDRTTGGQAALGGLFAMMAVMVILGQLPLAAVARRRLGAPRALGLGFALLSGSFAAVAAFALLPALPTGLALTPAVVMVALLTLGQMLAVPVAQDQVPRLAGERRLGSYFGFLSSAGGLAVLAGSAGVGALFDLVPTTGAAAAVPWAAIAVVPALGGCALWRLVRGRISHEQE